MPVLRSAFIALSHNRSIRKFAEHSAIGGKLSSRFVAGLEIDDALRVCAQINQQGMHVTLDSLGESVSTAEEAHKAADIYHRLLDQIAARKLDSNISVKLTQMGLALDPALAESIATSLAQHAQATGNFLRIDMEDTPVTQVTLDIVRRINAQPELRGSIGIVIQSYLYRSQADIEQLIAEGIRVRLCKGAYKEPPEVAFPKKSDVDANYTKLANMLLQSPIYHGLATHDENMIAAAKSFVAQRNIDRNHFEFQMLFGVRRDLQRKLVAEGFNVRVYIPFGREWYPYFMRRLAERPANVLFIARQLFRQ
jgi:proline dehydrogenase